MFLKSAIGLSISTLLAVAAVSPALAADDLAARFGALEMVQDMSMAPDGSKVAYVERMAAGSIVHVADLQTGNTKDVLAMRRDLGRIGYCTWSNTVRLVCNANYIVDDGRSLLGFRRLFAVNADGTQSVQLSARTSVNARGVDQGGGSIIDYDVGNAPGTVLMTRNFVPDDRIDSRMGSDKEGLGVEQVDTVTLKRTTVEQPRRSASEYISDGHGTVRIVGTRGADEEGYVAGSTVYLYRRPNSRNWERLSVVSADGAGFNPYVVDRKANAAFGFDKEGGFQTLYSVTLDGKLARNKILGRSDVDVDQLVTIGRNGRVVGAGYATERRQIEYFDPELKALSASLRKALPGQPTVDFVDSSADESKLMIVTGGDTQPGVYYLYDKATHHLEELLPSRPQLSGMTLAPMKPVQYKAADGTLIPAYLTLPPGGAQKGLPAIVMPHGGPSARDEWGFDWLVQYFAARGYAVLQPNFRGSSGYGANWYQKNGFQSWKTSIGDVDDGARWLSSSGIAARDKIAIFGWSYGGYAALQSQVLDPALYRAIVAVAPVTDLAMLKQESLEYTNGRLVAAFVGDGPHVRAGSPLQNANAFVAPVLIFHGDKDQNVEVEQSRAMVKKLQGIGKQATYVEFKGLDHQLFDAAARTRLLSESDEFLRKAMGL